MHKSVLSGQSLLFHFASYCPLVVGCNNAGVTASVSPLRLLKGSTPSSLGSDFPAPRGHTPSARSPGKSVYPQRRALRPSPDTAQQLTSDLTSGIFCLTQPVIDQPAQPFQLEAFQASQPLAREDQQASPSDSLSLRHPPSTDPSNHSQAPLMPLFPLNQINLRHTWAGLTSLTGASCPVTCPTVQGQTALQGGRAWGSGKSTTAASCTAQG